MDPEFEIIIIIIIIIRHQSSIIPSSTACILLMLEYLKNNKTGSQVATKIFQLSDLPSQFGHLKKKQIISQQGFSGKMALFSES